MMIAIDTETGGLKAGVNALLSVAAIKLDNDLNPIPGEQLYMYIKPHPLRTVEAQAAKINGYTPEKWEANGAIDIQRAMKRLHDFVPFAAQALAHNAGFDQKFIDDALELTGIKLGFSYRWHCSMATFAAVNEAFQLGRTKCSLDSLADISGHWGKEHKRGDHSALDDALACAVGYKWLINKIRTGNRAVIAENKNSFFHA
jgi:DNA polymerase III epsilon subunit-like protein